MSNNNQLVLPFGSILDEPYKPVVLVVDDLEASCRLMAQLVKSLGYEAAVAYDGLSALDKYAEVKPALVLLDAMMPGMNGFDVCRRLHDLYGKATAPVFMVTALNDLDSISLALEAGAFDYITKPFQVEILRNRIYRTLQTHQFQQMIEQRNQMLETLNLVSKAANSTLDVPDILEKVIYITAHAVGAAVACICDIDEENDTTTVLADYYGQYVGDVPASDVGVKYSLSRHFPMVREWATHPNGYVTIDITTAKLSAAERDHYEAYGAQTLFMVSLCIKDRLFGYMEYWYQEPHELKPIEVNLLVSAAVQVAMILNNALLHAEAQRYLKELEQRNSELDAYSRMIAHDLQSPVQAFMNYTDFVLHDLENTLPDLQRDYLLKAIQAANGMADMIDSLLHLAKLRDAAAVVVPVETNRVVQSSIIRFENILRSNGIQIQVAPFLPPVLGHAPWVEEVFANLIGNAIKYLGESNPRPMIWIRGQHLGETVRFEIEDNGIGISDSELHRLFESFSRLSNVGFVKGFGLGLSIVQRIVHKLNGQVGVSSELGKGSTFWFTLPSVRN